MQQHQGAPGTPTHTTHLAARPQVSEERLIELLEQVNEQTGATKVTKVTIQRRRAFDDDEF